MAVTREQVLEALGKVASPDGTPLPATGALSEIVAGDKVLNVAQAKAALEVAADTLSACAK